MKSKVFTNTEQAVKHYFPRYYKKCIDEDRCIMCGQSKPHAKPLTPKQLGRKAAEESLAKLR